MCKKLIACFLISLLSLSLFGCGGTSSAPSPLGDGNGKPSLAPDLRVSCRMLGATTENAYYYLAYREENVSYNIKCIDFESGEELFLCNRPECTHDNESCPAWRAYGGSTASLAIIDNGLFLVYSGAINSQAYRLYGDASLPRTVRLNLDGSGAKEIARLGPGESASGSFAVDANNGISYHAIQTVREKDGEIECFYNIVATDLNSGEVKTSRRFDEEGLAVATATGSKLILVYENTENAESLQDTKLVYISYDVLTGETEEMAVVPSYPPVTNALDGKLFCYKPAAGSFEVTDLLTKEKTILQPQTDISGYSRLFPYAVLDGYLYVLAYPEGPGSSQEEWLISTEDGSVYPITLPMQVDNPQAMQRPICICAETKTDYLVQTAVTFKMVAFEKQEDGSALWMPTPYHTYALISKEDFRANRPNYRYITPME